MDWDTWRTVSQGKKERERKKFFKKAAAEKKNNPKDCFKERIFAHSEMVQAPVGVSAHFQVYRMPS